MQATTAFLGIFPLLLGLAGCAGSDSSSELQRQIDEVETQISAKEYVAAAATASDGLDEFPDSQTLRTLQLRADCGIFRNQLDFVSSWEPVSLDSEAAWERAWQLSGGERIGLKEELLGVFPFVADSFVPIDQRASGDTEGYKSALVRLSLLEYAAGKTKLALSVSNSERVKIERYDGPAQAEVVDSLGYTATGIREGSEDEEFPALCQADDIALSEENRNHSETETFQSLISANSKVLRLALVYSAIRDCEELGSLLNGFECPE